MKLTMGRDMTTGSVPRQLLLFSLPIFFINLIYSGYGVVNMVWVGSLLGQNAVAASAVCLPVTFILAGIIMGATTATSVLVARYYGSKEKAMLDKTIGTSFSLSIMLSVLLTAAGVIFAGDILRAMDTPQEILPTAQEYLIIMMAGTILMYMFLLISSILRGMGDSLTMLIIMIISIVLNAVLDPLLIGGMGPFPKLGLDGAAIASLSAQTLALAGAFIYLGKKKILRLGKGLFRFDGAIAFQTLRIALPSVFQACFVQVGTMFITSFVNSFGTVATAALGAAGRVDTIAMMPAAALNMAVSTQTGQCIGAGKTERVKGIFKWGMLINLLATLPMALLAALIPVSLLKMFVGGPDVLAIGTDYLRILCATYLLAAIFYISNGVMTGAGRTLFPMAISLVSLWAVRVPLASTLMKTGMGIDGIWLAILVSFGVNLAASLILYLSGAWRKKAKVKCCDENAIMAQKDNPAGDAEGAPV